MLLYYSIDSCTVLIVDVCIVSTNKTYFRHVQCVLNFADNLSQDGGTLIVPGFHRILSQWCTDHINLRRNLPWLVLPKQIETELLQYAHRVPMREVSNNNIQYHLYLHSLRYNNTIHCMYIFLMTT